MFRLYPLIHPVHHLYLGLLEISRANSFPTSLLFVNRILALRPNLVTKVVKH